MSAAFSVPVPPLAALAVAAVTATLPAQGPLPARILWVQRPEERSEGWFEAARELGFTAVNVSSGADPKLPGRHGLSFYLDQPAGKGVLELRDRQFEPVRDAYERTRRPSELARPACLSDPGVQSELAETALARLVAAREHRPLGVALGDEVSLTRHGNPLDFCFAGPCLAAFRGWLQDRYGDLATLNRAWRTEFGSWEHVEPLTTDQVRRRELGGVTFPADLRAWSDHREFMDGVLERTLDRLTSAVGEAAPGLPCGLTGMQPPSAFGGHDFERLVPGLTLYEAYDIGGARELAMSLAAPGARQLCTLFPPKTGELAAMVRARYAEALAHGASAIVAWSGDDALDEGGEPTAYGRALSRAFGDLEGAAPFAGARMEYSPVWLVESQPSVRAWWMLDSSADGMTWIRRLSSYEAGNSTSIAAREAWVRLLEDLGLQPRFVPEAELADRLPRERPLAFVLPACIALSDSATFALRVYVTGGGTLLADHGPALYDEDLRLRERPALDELFGIEERSTRSSHLLVRQGRASSSGRLASGASAAETDLRGKLGDSQGDFEVFLENRHGRGRAYYLNLAVCEYGAVRLDPDRVGAALDLRKRVRHVLGQAQVVPPFDVRGEGLPTCLERMVLRGADGRRLLAVRCNALEEPSILARLADEGLPEVELRFPFPVRLKDLLRGEELGPAASFRMTLDPYGALFLEDVTGR